MKNNLNSVCSGIIVLLLTGLNIVSSAQKGNSVIKKYLTELPSVQVNNSLQKLKMTAVYTNRDLYGNFTGKTKISGEYTRGLKGDSCRWNNVLISSAVSYDDEFPTGEKQKYIENFTYLPSAEMLKPEAFKDFPPNPETVYSRNLIWDMMAIENFAWNNYDSLKLNRQYSIPDSGNEFSMADIGTYSHAGIEVSWTGISAINDEMCAIIEFRAVDNKIALSMESIKTKGTEQYWGTIWISLNNKSIEHAEMYGGTIQEIEVTGMENKFLVKTIRELFVDKILQN
jgi:hypothetical protein